MGFFSTISYTAPQLTPHLWKSIQKGFDTQVNLSTTIYARTDGLVVRTIKTLEDIFISCVM